MMITSVMAAADNNENLVGVFGTLSVVCFVLAVVFAVLAIAMFFIFDIRNIFDMRTGRAQKRVITEMEAENALTGRLINPNAKAKGRKKKKKVQGSAQHSSFSEKLQKMKEKDVPNYSSQNYQNFQQQQQYQQPYNGYEQAYAPKPLMEVPRPAQNPIPTPNYNANNVNSFSAPVNNDMSQTTLLGNNDASQTTVLGNNDASQTTVLSNNDASQTTVLSNNDASQTTVLSNNDASQTTVLSNNDASQTTVLSNNDSSQTTVLSRENPAPVQQAPPPAPAPNAANAPQPVHNVAKNGELGKAAGSINFKVGDGETSRLDAMTKAAAAPKVHFNIVKNIMLIHTQEIIQ